MARTTSTKKDKDKDKDKDNRATLEAQSAERDVALNEAKFEAAMDHLADKVEDDSRQVRSKIQQVTGYKDRIVGLKNDVKQQASARVRSLEATVQNLISQGEKAIEQIRRNPRPFTLAAIGLFGAALVIAGMTRSGAFTPDSPAEDLL